MPSMAMAMKKEVERAFMLHLIGLLLTAPITILVAAFS